MTKAHKVKIVSYWISGDIGAVAGKDQNGDWFGYRKGQGWFPYNEGQDIESGHDWDWYKISESQAYTRIKEIENNDAWCVGFKVLDWKLESNNVT